MLLLQRAPAAMFEAAGAAGTDAGAQAGRHALVGEAGLVHGPHWHEPASRARGQAFLNRTFNEQMLSETTANVRRNPGVPDETYCPLPG